MAAGDERAVRGFLEPFFETGTEGVVWSLQDPGLPGYDGLFALRDGDALRVLDGAGATRWEGEVRLERCRRRPGGRGQQAVLGMWVHGLQRGMEPEAWARMFLDRRRAVLEPGPATSRDAGAHPFRGGADGLGARLAALPDARAMELFRAALYPWLVFYSDGGWRSMATEWGLAPEEILLLLGSPTAEQVLAWRTYPKRGGDTLLPFSMATLERLGLLWAINAALLWGHPDAAARAAWLDRPHPRLGGARPRDALLGGGAEGLARALAAARAAEP